MQRLINRKECGNTNTTLDDPNIYDGAHVSVQIVGRRLQEEKMLAIAEKIGSLLASK